MSVKLSKNSPYSKILLVLGDRIGDALFCTPAVRLLKNSLPNLQLDAMVFSKAAAEVFLHNPDIHQIHVNNKAKINHTITQQYPLIINLIYEIEREKKLFKIPKKNYISVGTQNLTRPRALQLWEFIKDYLETPIDEASQQYLLYPTESDKQNLQAKLTNLKVAEDDIVIGMQLGCHRVAARSWKIWNRKRHRHKKVWDIENYMALAKALRQALPTSKLIITGAKSEAFLAKKFKKEVPWAIDMIGKTSVHELANLMDRFNVYVTHDTGSVHVACARQTPLVALFANTATAVEFTGPYPLLPHYSVINKESMADITVDEVLNVILEKLSSHFKS